MNISKIFEKKITKNIINVLFATAVIILVDMSLNKENQLFEDVINRLILFFSLLIGYSLLDLIPKREK